MQPHCLMMMRLYVVKYPHSLFGNEAGHEGFPDMANTERYAVKIYITVTDKQAAIAAAQAKMEQDIGPDAGENPITGIEDALCYLFDTGTSPKGTQIEDSTAERLMVNG